MDRPPIENHHSANAPIPTFYDPAKGQAYSPDAARPNSPHNFAPEVDLHAPMHDAEGLQVDPNSAHFHSSPNESEQKPRKWAYFAGSDSVQGTAHMPAPAYAETKPERRTCGMKRKHFIILVVVLVLIVCGAIAGGVGGYEAGKSSKKNKDKTSAYVTSGTTGLAQPPCTSAVPSATPTPNMHNPYLAKGATFNMTCRRGIPKNAKNNGKPVTDIRQEMKYTFKACLDACALDAACGGVTYLANLTRALGEEGQTGNCRLLNGTWEATAVGLPNLASGVKE